MLSVYVNVYGIRKNEEELRNHQPRFEFPDDFSVDKIIKIVRKWIIKNFKIVGKMRITINKRNSEFFEGGLVTSNLKISEHYLIMGGKEV